MAAHGDDRTSTVIPVADDKGAILFVHWYSYLGMAREARDRARMIIEIDPRSWPSESIAAILMSALAVEAFINELGPLVRSDTGHYTSEHLPEKGVLTDLAVTLDEVETNRGTIALKYHMASKILSGNTFDVSRSPFQDFSRLITLRNLLVHLRPGDTVDENGKVVPSEKVIRQFQRERLTYSSDPGDKPQGTVSWLNELQTERMATWAYAAACGIVRAVIDMLPVPTTVAPLFLVGWLRTVRPALDL
jgi:hypothetical protein